MAVIIKGVEAGSLAARKGIRPGDTLEAINGEAIRDVLDSVSYTHLTLPTILRV